MDFRTAPLLHNAGGWSAGVSSRSARTSVMEYDDLDEMMVSGRSSENYRASTTSTLSQSTVSGGIAPEGSDGAIFRVMEFRRKRPKRVSAYILGDRKSVV